MADKIRPLKIESPADGTQDDMGYPTEANPDEDYVAAKGFAFENLDTHTVDLVGGEITFTDPSNGQRKLSRLVHPQINKTATTDPTITDDSTQGYEVGSTWVNTQTDESFTCVDAAPGSAIWLSTTSGGGTASEVSFFDAYNDTSDSFDDTFTDIPLNVEREKDTPFTHVNDSPEVTITETFTYLIVYKTGFDQTGGGRSMVQSRLMRDEGSGYNEVPGTRIYTYSRNGAQGLGTSSAPMALALNAGDKIKIQIAVESGATSDFELEPEASSLVIVQIKGEKGDKGDPGSGGVAGINIEEDGIQVTTSPASTLNFTGDPVTVIETTSGEAEIALQSRITIKENDTLVPGTPHTILNFKGDYISTTPSGNQVDIQFEAPFIQFFGNIVRNTMEIESLKNVDVEGFSYFVDTFESDVELDPSSSNFFVDTEIGSVGLNPGGVLTSVETTKAEFDLGTFNNTESFITAGGNGSLRKLQTVEGAIITLEDFESIANVTNQTSGILTLSQASSPFVNEGSFSLKADLDFGGDATNETATFEIDLGVGGLDISTDKYINLYYLKQESGEYNIQLEFEDETGNTYTTPSVPISSSSLYQKYQLETTALFAAIDETELRYVRVNLLEQSAGQTIIEVIGQLDNDHYELHEGDSLKQTFIVTEQVICQRIKIRVRWENSQPSDGLAVAVANIFETTLGVATLGAADASGTWAEYVLTFDNPFNLSPGNTYAILFQTDADRSDAWDIHDDSTESYTDGQLFYNGNSRNDSLHFTLYTPAIQESIYFDQLEVEAESTYAATGDFTSQAINLGLVPDALDDLRWDETDGTADDVEIRIRTATTSGGLTSATWSAWFTDPAGNDIGTETPNQWIQYQVRWINGTTTESDVVNSVTIEYSTTPGSGSATVISLAEITSSSPSTFIMNWEESINTGSIVYSISRDGQTTWQNVLSTQNGDLQSFTSGSGTTIHLRAVITGNAKLFAWGVACDEEFI